MISLSEPNFQYNEKGNPMNERLGAMGLGARWNGVGYNTAVCRIKHSVQYTWVWGLGAMGAVLRRNGFEGARWNGGRCNVLIHWILYSLQRAICFFKSLSVRPCEPTKESTTS